MFKPLFIYLALTSASIALGCQAVPNEKTGYLKVEVVGGKLKTTTGQEIDSGLDVITNFHQSKAGIFLTGYVIDEDDVNHPSTTWISLSSDKREYQPFENILSSFFNFRDNFYLLDNTGRVFTWEEPSWTPSDISLKPNSEIIEATDNLIACAAPNLTKANYHAGSCYTNTWNVELVWDLINRRYVAISW